MKLIAIIPARGGSKGIPGKNIKEINGKPLIAYSIEQALDSGVFDHVFVNTESKEIADIAKKYGAKVPFLRPDELAEDRAKTISVIKHGITEYRLICDFDAVVLMQPTSPFRRKADLLETKRLLEIGVRAIASYSPAQEHPSRMKMIKENRVQELIPEPETLRRQDMKQVFVRNGAIYAFTKEVPFELDTLLPENHYPLIMDDFASVNIDEPFDMLVAELLITHAWDKKGSEQ